MAELRSVKMHVVILMSLKGLFKSLMIHISTLAFLGFIMFKAGAATKTSYMLFPKKIVEMISQRYIYTELNGFLLLLVCYFCEAVQ